MGDRDRDQEPGQHPDQHRREQRLVVVAEEVDGRGRDQADRRERAGQPEPHAEPWSFGLRPGHLRGVAACHGGLLTQSSQTGCGRLRDRPPWNNRHPLRTLVFIPAWNEEASIDAVIADVRAHMPARRHPRRRRRLDRRDHRAGARGRRPRRHAALQPGARRGAADRLPLGAARGLRLPAPTSTPTASTRPPRWPGCSPRSQADRADLVIGSRYADADRAAARRRAPTGARTTGRPGRGGSGSTSSASSSPWRPASASPTRPAACAPPTAA